jgi:PAS domain S-box-containing protein
MLLNARRVHREGSRMQLILLAIEDITESRRAVDTLNVSEVRYRRLFETAQDGILILDADERRIVDANPFLTDMLGYRYEELLGKELWEIGLFGDIEASKAAFRELQEKGYIRYEDLPLQSKDGRRTDVEFVSNVYEVDHQKIIQCNIRDVSARKRAEEALREAHARLEKRVEERTAQLARANQALKAEMEAHKQAEAARMELLQQLITAQEEERHRIARELHDQMGQHLAALILGLKVLQDGLLESSPARERLQQLLQLADLIGKEVHHLALELRPTALDDLGLHATLVNYVEQWSERSGIEVDFHSTGLEAERLPAPLETALYRIVQEGLTNVLKHARARRVSLIVQRLPEQVLAILEDDGCGFDAEAAINASGAAGRLGLLGMRERATLVGGTLTVESTPACGTTIFARIPLPAEGRKDSDD